MRDCSKHLLLRFPEPSLVPSHPLPASNYPPQTTACPSHFNQNLNICATNLTKTKTTTRLTTFVSEVISPIVSLQFASLTVYSPIHPSVFSPGRRVPKHALSACRPCLTSNRPQQHQGQRTRPGPPNHQSLRPMECAHATASPEHTASTPQPARQSPLESTARPPDRLPLQHRPSLHRQRNRLPWQRHTRPNTEMQNAAHYGDSSIGNHLPRPAAASRNGHMNKSRQFLRNHTIPHFCVAAPGGTTYFGRFGNKALQSAVPAGPLQARLRFNVIAMACHRD